MTAAPDDIAALKSALATAERRADLAEAEAARGKATASNAEALIAHLTLQIEKLRRELYGTRSERKARLLDQLEMQLKDAQSRRERGRACSGRSGGQDNDDSAVHSQTPLEEAFPRTPAA